MGFTNGCVCSAINCTNNRKKTPHLSFFRFPKDPERCRKWQVNCGREDLLQKDANYLYHNIKFCSLHFEQNQFMNELRNKLVWNAVPTLFDIPNKPPHVAPKRKLQQTCHNKVSKANKLFRPKRVVNVGKTSDVSVQPYFEYQMLECKVEIAEDDTGSDAARRPQMLEAVEVKEEPPEESAEADVVDESQMFEAVEMKVEPPEDPTVSEPQVFEFVAVKTGPCKGSSEDAGVDVSNFQAPASTVKTANSTKTGNGAAARVSRGVTIHRQARKVILKVAECCELEKKARRLLFPLSDPLARAAFYVGRSIESLRELQRAGADVDGPTPTKKRKTDGEKMDSIDERVVRETIEEFYTVRKTVPTLKKLASALREKTGCEWGSAAALRKTLKSLGFVWRKVDGRSFLLERFGQVRRRSRFLVAMKHAREVGREVFYLDESWVDTNLQCGKYRDGGGPPSASDAVRLVVWSVGSRRGFLEGARLAFRADPSQKGMSAADFEKWLEGSVLPKLPPASVVVMDDAPHHCREADPAPSEYDPKAHMVAWLRRRGVDCGDATRKYVLWELVRANGGSRKDYVVDQMASVRGHSVMRLPPNVRNLNAADPVWALIVENIRQRATPGLSFASLQKVVAAAFQSVIDKDWEGYCERVRVVEEDYWRRDGVVEEAVEDVVRNPDAWDSSEDSEGSITEDSESD